MRFLGIFVSLCLGALVLPASASVLTVSQNSSEVVRLESEAATVIVGNPMIADVVVLDGNLLIVQGRLFGTTNVIALNAGGEAIANIQVTVGAEQHLALSLYRGADRVTYACPGNCVQVYQPGDDPDRANSIFSQDRQLQNLSSWPLGLETQDDEE